MFWTIFQHKRGWLIARECRDDTLVTCSERIIVLMVFISTLSSSSSFVRLIIIIIRSNHHIRHVIVATEKKMADPICKCQSIVKFLQKTLLVFVEVWSIIGTIFLPSPSAIGVSWLRGAKLSPGVKYYNNIWISFCKQNCILSVYF